MLSIINNCQVWLSRQFNIIEYLAAENLALRQQLIVLKRNRARPRLREHDAARVDSGAQDSDLREQELNAGAVPWCEQSGKPDRTMLIRLRERPKARRQRADEFLNHTSCAPVTLAMYWPCFPFARST